MARSESPRFIAVGNACAVVAVRNDGIAQVGRRLGIEVDIDERALSLVGVEVERVVVVAHPVVVAQVFALGDREGLVHVADQRLGQILEIDGSFVHKVDAVSVFQYEMSRELIASRDMLDLNRCVRIIEFGHFRRLARQIVVHDAGFLVIDRSRCVRIGQIVGSLGQYGVVVVGRFLIPEVEYHLPAGAGRRERIVRIDRHRTY